MECINYNNKFLIWYMIFEIIRIRGKLPFDDSKSEIIYKKTI